MKEIPTITIDLSTIKVDLSSMKVNQVIEWEHPVTVPDFTFNLKDISVDWDTLDEFNVEKVKSLSFKKKFKDFYDNEF